MPCTVSKAVLRSHHLEQRLEIQGKIVLVRPQSGGIQLTTIVEDDAKVVVKIIVSAVQSEIPGLKAGCTVTAVGCVVFKGRGKYEETTDTDCDLGAFCEVSVDPSKLTVASLGNVDLSKVKIEPGTEAASTDSSASALSNDIIVIEETAEDASLLQKNQSTKAASKTPKKNTQVMVRKWICQSQKFRKPARVRAPITRTLMAGAQARASSPKVKRQQNRQVRLEHRRSR